MTFSQAIMKEGWNEQSVQAKCNDHHVHDEEHSVQQKAIEEEYNDQVYETFRWRTQGTANIDKQDNKLHA